MDYRVASNIRGKSLSSLMTDKIVSGKGVGSAFRGAISDKLKARATGVKEKFDPMNIAKFMTGGSRLGPAIVGRLTGRSQSDINYFAGNKTKRGNYTQVPTSIATPGEGLGGSAVEVLNRMLTFMQKTREQDLKKKETAKQFIEEQKVEEQRRHKEFVDVLKQYTSIGTTARLENSGENEPNLLSAIGNFITGALSKLKDWVQDWVKGFVGGLLTAIDWIKDLKWLTSLKMLDGLKWLLGVASGPAMIAALIAAGLGAALIKLWADENEKLRRLGGQEAADLSAERQTEEALSAMDPAAEAAAIANAREENKYDKMKKLIARKQEVVRALMEEQGYEADSYDKNGGYIFKDAEGKPPSAEILEGVEFQADRLLESGEPLPEVKSKKKILPYGIKPSAGRSGVEQLMDYNARQRPLIKAFGNKQIERATPVVPTPSSRMDDAIKENLNLNTDPMGNIPYVPPFISNNTNTVDLPDRTIPATATVRDKTPILDYVMEQYASPI